MYIRKSVEERGSLKKIIKIKSEGYFWRTASLDEDFF
jgi:hypothetical protein